MKEISFGQLVKNTFPSLSAGQKKVAEYILGNLEQAAFQTSEQIGREVNVSQTTVIRLSYALGFSGFSKMQSSIQKDVLKTSSNDSLVEEVNITKEINPFSKVIEKDIAMLRKMYSQLNQIDLWKAVDSLIKADRVLVVGHRASYAAAQWFTYCLSEIRDHVEVSTNTTESIERILALTDQSVVFALSFPRYSKEVIKITECAQQQGAELISITDHVLSPVGRRSEIAFTTEINLESGANSVTSIFSLLNLFLVGINMKMEGQIQTRRKSLEQLYSRFDILIE
ncbi:MurR/RpiR family transcriptional regulator [Risungbinella massiliensis]|uniref:MurR/RpiR family transcriptional regulator n=1 Tax=Risungbinella massiliensis TaxID=1329796 RepID=UPI0005CC68E3|nr:MurR/RpiR family transcriptional regulator [Risungbinella massiliensis]